MKKIFIINAGQKFGHLGGRFNETLANTSLTFFESNPEFE